ncbi:hypothetical protein DFJ43DRAFT_1062591 [Lentinula guzmanii]|uniref:Secreted protein n=3 Tax=Lentinula TaxID=5352 RepID=A0AA38JX56_9AGAR|nr:hypothetical protein DFJ43DRAFT_1062591 [Lentinula guzmanii]KAJ3743381.1 hypothetical protein DFH05DRAFT_1495759 [Lentinula detonsa]KAJ3990327.1 hypothetical protein F5890DRAFT_1481083 [Lentinula detonsa]KAJ3998629.1 hypothetical protein F5050DRAFT_1743696 [Lentinula boryana]
MLAFAFSSLLIALLLIYVGAGPSVLASIMALDDSLDAHESSLAAVAARNPFRDSGPPANMAKLILLRHKIQTTSRKRKSSTHTRQVSRTYTIAQPRPAKAPWLRFGRSVGKQFY